MGLEIGAFIDKSLKTTNADELFSLYRKAMSELGIDRIIYSAMRNTAGFETQVPGISHSYPDDWVKYYVEKGMIDVDPVRTRGLTSRRAFTWDSMMAEQKLTTAQKEVMDLGKEAGLNSGVGMAFHGPMGEVFGVGLASSEDNPNIDHFLTEIEVLSTQFHITFSALFERPQTDEIKLSNRELEVLKWLASGKSNWAIGEILSISEHGVDFHVRNILKKLDADSRVTAVVKALHNGLINLS